MLDLLARLWPTWVGAVAVGCAVALGLAAMRRVRRQHTQQLALLRSVAIQMLQNGPRTDDTSRLQELTVWWEDQVLQVLPKVGATPGEIASFRDPGIIYHQSIVTEKIARLDAIIKRTES